MAANGTQTPLVPDSRWKNSLDGFLAEYRGRMVVVLYPRRIELGARHTGFAALVARLGNRAVLVEPGESAEWRETFYIDQAHPTPEGHIRLAELIARELQ